MADNPKYNNIDKVFVSKQPWEVSHFVDHFLKEKKYKVDDANRAIVRAAMGGYTGRHPVQRDELTTYLDQLFAARNKAKTA